MQHNVINKIENLDCLKKLETLYLGYNNIVVVEGLDRLRNLTVLHIENQKLSHGESLCFDRSKKCTCFISKFVMLSDFEAIC